MFGGGVGSVLGAGSDRFGSIADFIFGTDLDVMGRFGEKLQANIIAGVDEDVFGTDGGYFSV
ncbi:hypothetical protein AGMMS50222_09410 [Endomicrobiia bacterium]|nr:hypothetical protein AGMMS49556_08780 [Endomicrobiia bacterium]GHT71875.1 hypothetical protein AGMMS49950_09340 [Endomicrobiia bacterium]GHT76598.1 hypothetical protein AGMMS50222_09410 [Endomicrobiia bacterium]